LAWVRSYLDDLQAVRLRQIEVQVKDVDEQVIEQIVESFQSAPSRLLLLDYDGTLVPIKSKPHEAYPDNEPLELLRELSSKPATEVVVISGRNYQVLDDWLGELPVNIVAEHGA